MPLSVGARVGPYEVIHLLGAGGMGEVYRARDTRLDRLVALKSLSAATVATPHQIERFKVEARAISRVSHPNICALYDIIELDGLTLLVMELLEGETLATRLERGPLPVEQALKIGAQIADGLHAAHRHGVTHRDLTPANVMLTRDGVKLLDFGLAKLTRAEPDPNAGTASVHLTDEGSVLGTLPYMAPEQVEGRDVDARTDIFALGVVLFEMLTGKRPFEGSSRASIAASILVHEPPAVSSLVRVAPPSLDRAVRKCLAKDSDDRWQTVRDFSSELRWIAEASEARGMSAERLAIGRHWRWVVAGVVAIAGLGSVWLLGGHAARIAPDTKAARPLRWTPVTFRAGVVSSARFAPDGDTIVYSAAWEGHPYALFMTRRGTAESRALGISPARLLGVSSSGELAYIRGNRPALNFLQPLFRFPNVLVRVPLTGGAPRDVLDYVIAAEWSPRTDELAVVRRGELQWPVGHVIYKSALPMTHLRISRDASRIAGFEGSSVVVFDRSGTKSTLSSGWDSPTGLAWSPDGSEVWFSAARTAVLQPTLWAVTLAGSERVLLDNTPTLLSLHDVFADGRVLVGRHLTRMGLACHIGVDSQPRELAWLDGSAPEAIARDGSAVVIGELLSGGLLDDRLQRAYLRPTDGSDAVRIAAGYPEDISPDGRLIAVVRRTGVPSPTLTVVPVGPGETTQLPTESLVRIGELNFLPDGKRLVYAGAEKGRPGRIFVQDLAGGSPRFISDEGVATDGHATPDGKYVVGKLQEVFALYPIEGGNPRPVKGLTANDMPLQFREDGKLWVRRMDSWPPDVDLVDLDSGKRQLWKTVRPADLTGIDLMIRIVITPDGKSYCYDHVRFLSDLFVVEGIR